MCGHLMHNERLFFCSVYSDHIPSCPIFLFSVLSQAQEGWEAQFTMPPWLAQLFDQQAST